MPKPRALSSSTVSVFIGTEPRRAKVSSEPHHYFQCYVWSALCSALLCIVLPCHCIFMVAFFCTFLHIFALFCIFLHCIFWIVHLHFPPPPLFEGALAAVRTRCKFWVFGDPPGDNCNHQEASRKEQKLPRSLWDLLATIEKTEEDGSCACNSALLGFYRLFGRSRLGMAQRYLTTNSCHGADTVQQHHRSLLPCPTLCAYGLSCPTASAKPRPQSGWQQLET